MWELCSMWKEINCWENYSLFIFSFANTKYISLSALFLFANTASWNLQQRHWRPSGRQSGGKWSKSDNMESSINCEQNGNGIWLDLFIWLTHTQHNTDIWGKLQNWKKEWMKGFVWNMFVEENYKYTVEKKRFYCRKT